MKILLPESHGNVYYFPASIIYATKMPPEQKLLFKSLFCQEYAYLDTYLEYF